MTEADFYLAEMAVMTDEEKALAEMFYESIQAHSKFSPRTRQSSAFVVGISDLGFCSERTRRLMAEIPMEEEKDVLEAFLGTAVGDHVEAAVSNLYDNALRGQRVTVELRGDGGIYQVSGHPDLLFPDLVVDVKTSDGLEKVRRTGPSQQQFFQRHLYALGAHNAGLFDVPLEQVRTANVWVDRSGKTKELHVHMDMYSPDIVAEATRWLDEVVYAHLHGQEARKEPPRQMCEKVCGHFLDCRAHDTDIEGLITDPEQLAAVTLYKDGMKLAKVAAKMKEEGKAALEGVRGYTDEYAVRWTWINGTHVDFDRAGYNRLDITKVKGKTK